MASPERVNERETVFSLIYATQRNPNRNKERKEYCEVRRMGLLNKTIRLVDDEAGVLRLVATTVQGHI